MTDTPLGLLIVVCDGMDGSPAGKTASRIAAEIIAGTVVSAKPEMDPAAVLRIAVKNANRVVIGKTLEHPEFSGMGTTCVALLLRDDKGYIAHVGDSRCYQIRDNAVAFRTSDHSLVGEQVRSGEMTEEEARTSEKANILTRAIGGAEKIEAEIDIVKVEPHDRFAIMTDGVWGGLPASVLVDALSAYGAIENVVYNIVESIDVKGRSNGGGHDNMTLAVVEIPGEEVVGVGAEFAATGIAAGAADASAQDSTAPYSIEDDPSSTSDGVFNGEMIEVEESEEEPSKRWRPLMWIGIAICALLAGVTVWSLFFSHSSEEEKPAAVADTAKAKTDSIPKVVDSIPAAPAAVVGSTATPAYTPSAGSYADYDATLDYDTTPAYEQPSPEGNVSVQEPEPAPAPVESPAVAGLKEAQSILESVASKVTPGSSADELRSVGKEWIKKRDNIVALIQKAEKYTDDPSKKRAVEQVRKQIMNMKINADDGASQAANDFTRQANKYSKQLSALINNL